METHYQELSKLLGKEIGCFRDKFVPESFTVKELRIIIKYLRKICTTGGSLRTGKTKESMIETVSQFWSILRAQIQASSDSREKATPPKKERKENRSSGQKRKKASSSAGKTSSQNERKRSPLNATTPKKKAKQKTPKKKAKQLVSNGSSSSRMQGKKKKDSKEVEERQTAETKLEPDSFLNLTPVLPEERPNLDILTDYGFGFEQILRALRKCGNVLESALNELVRETQMRNIDTAEAQLMDEVAYQSEVTRESELERQRKEEEMTIAYGDVVGAGLFNMCSLLNNCSTIREAVNSFDNPDLRNDCIKLLVLERKATRWYGIVSRNYFECLAEDINAIATNHKTLPESFIKEKVKTIEKAMYAYPENSGGVPLEFSRCEKNMTSPNNSNNNMDEDVVLVNANHVPELKASSEHPVIDIP